MGASKDGDDEAKRVSRRSLFLGVGAAAAIAPVLESCEPAKAPSAAAGVVGPGTVEAVLHVNGAATRVAVEPRETLADVLRFQIGLTGTKVGCDRGACSACTVYLDGTPVLACTTFVLDAVGREVTTIEGLARGAKLHPVQEAFIEHDAMQCGFCTPGMVMSCAALLQRTRTPTIDDVRAATSGNLCRCGTYHDVFDATLAAARRMGG
ncbi:MAG TPA: (2Fe-2S)-binding protein [Polyangiaceae bacterium]|jgi:aerobic-type carbon monoxide dehydrogenase small subunit (CoxS/CutS family)